MIKLLDRYMLRQYAGNFIAAMISFITIFIVVDVIDHLDKFIDTEITRDEIFQYYIYTLPWYVSIGLPMALLLSTVFCMGLLQRRNELTAMKASGISIHRVSISILAIGVISTVFTFYFENLIVAPSLHKRAQIEMEYFQSSRAKRAIKKQDIFRQIDRDKILYIKRFNFKNNTAYNVSLQEYEGANIKYRLDAPVMNWDADSESWRLPAYRVRTAFGDDTLKFYYMDKDTLVTMDFSPVDLTKESVKPEEMNYWELEQFVQKLRDNGIKDPRWEVNLHFKMAFAVSSLLMILFGLSLSIMKPRSNMAVGMGMSIFIIFLYYGAIKFGQSLGYKGVVDPLLSVWAGNIIFFVVGGYLFARTRS